MPRPTRLRVRRDPGSAAGSSCDQRRSGAPRRSGSAAITDPLSAARAVGDDQDIHVCDAAEIDRLLGPDAAAFRLAYGVTDGGNWEGKTILNRLHQAGLGSPEEERALRARADVLLAARERRIRPTRDDKVLAGWNGLTIAALARASAVFRRPDWLRRAAAAFDSVCRNMTDGDRLAGGRPHRGQGRGFPT